MRDFNYEQTAKALVDNDISNLLSTIHEYKGRQTLLIETKADALDRLVEVAKIQSTGASNRIEGIYTSNSRIEEIVGQKSEPRNRSENEIAGYRDVLSTIHESYEYIPLNANILLQLHRDLYQYSGTAYGGQFKDSDNAIEEVDEQGNKRVRFQPVHAAFTKEYVERICREYNNTAGKGNVDSLLLIPMFILDFLCIHPFNDGNGRMSRLLTLLLLYKAGYTVGKYISLEMLIENSKESYYHSLKESSVGWHEGNNSYAPFINYTLGVIIKACREFSSRVDIADTKRVSKAERVELTVKNHLGKISKRQIMEKCPDISESTIESALSAMLRDGKISKLGKGPATAYVYTH